jgi:hypothetical protein
MRVATVCRFQKPVNLRQEKVYCRIQPGKSGSDSQHREIENAIVSAKEKARLSASLCSRMDSPLLEYHSGI